MIQREIIRIAVNFGLEQNYNNLNVFELSFDNWSKGALLHSIFYKGHRVTFTDENLEMSIDDFCEFIIHPFILSMLGGDRQFIFMDMT